MENIKETVEKLIEKQDASFIGSVDENGFPNIKAMLKPCNREGIKVFYWHTNSPSMRIKHFRNNPKASVYFYDKNEISGVMLKGQMEIMDDVKIKKEFWKDSFNIFYTGGMLGGDFTIIKFTAKSGRYYCNLHTENFNIE